MLQVRQQSPNRIGAACWQQRGGLLVTELGMYLDDQRVGDSRRIPTAQGPIDTPPLHRRPLDNIASRKAGPQRRGERGTPDRRLRIACRSSDAVGIPGHRRSDQGEMPLVGALLP
ncbi:hypothetical protein [Micromonospora narathiwatensis]|uniref:hypothetical protein n=1 Tax=Micromonospora narathiwatensis TaxID=299146 RepID=UPI0014303324|nr:hypothetical protein [Micromonospora narathiwatensis]